MRDGLFMLWMLLYSMGPASAQVSVGIGLPNINVGFNLTAYPALVRVPGYPVYYAPRLSSNYFFYDGRFWGYAAERWYSSAWYNGPWWLVGPDVVPLYVLRIPVRYYRQPPDAFRAWQARSPNSPPHWGEQWGESWSRQRTGWDHWNHQAMPVPAPPPIYQRRYAGESYPSAPAQTALHEKNYRHESRDPLVRRQREDSRGDPAAVPANRPAPAVPQGRRPEPTAAAKPVARQSDPPPPSPHQQPQPLPPPVVPPAQRQSPQARPPSPEVAPRQPAVPGAPPPSAAGEQRGPPGGRVNEAGKGRERGTDDRAAQSGPGRGRPQAGNEQGEPRERDVRQPGRQEK
jgi:hypothetical protein